MEIQMSQGELTGSVALVTGGGGDIGGAIAQLFAQSGACVAVSDVAIAKAQAVCQAITLAGGRAIAIETDVARPEHAETAVTTTIAAFGKLTTLVSVAATATPDGNVETLSLEQWNKALDVNLTGAFLISKYAVPAIRAAGGGTVTAIASQLGQIGVPLRSPYGTTKAALIQFMRCLAVDYAAANIRCNTISPGPIDTVRTLHRFQGDRVAANLERGPSQLLGRTGRPEEVAEAALFLASDRSSFITGSDLLIDGGFLAFKGRLPVPAAGQS
jgi:NAD(P)-dependent dehydrogenase (short-subunit alcohol dehydrogenase family)